MDLVTDTHDAHDASASASWARSCKWVRSHVRMGETWSFKDRRIQSADRIIQTQKNLWMDTSPEALLTGSNKWKSVRVSCSFDEKLRVMKWLWWITYLEPKFLTSGSPRCARPRHVYQKHTCDFSLCDTQSARRGFLQCWETGLSPGLKASVCFPLPRLQGTAVTHTRRRAAAVNKICGVGPLHQHCENSGSCHFVI